MRARRAAVGLALAVTLLGACSGAAPAPERPDVADGVRATVDRFLDSDLGAPGEYDDVRAVVVSVGDQVVLERALQPGALRTTSNTASVTKSVMSLLVGIAIDEGLLRGVDQTLGELLPAYAGVTAPELRSTTLEQVLTMTAGLPADVMSTGQRAYPDARDLLTTTLAGGVTTPPGTFAYSSVGSHLLSAVLSQATGRSVVDFAREALFAPLGIDTEPAVEPVVVATSTLAPPGYDAAGFAWPVDEQGHALGYCCLKLGVRDLLALGRLVLDRGEVDGRQVVSAGWVARSTRAHVDAADGLAPRYGYQWWVTTAGGAPAVAAVGVGGQLVEVVPDRRLVVVVSTRLGDDVRVNSQGLLFLADLIADEVPSRRD